MLEKISKSRHRQPDGERAARARSRAQSAPEQIQVSDQGTAPLRLSVIIPAWKDHAHLVRSVPALVRLNALHEVIVVDASPDPATAEAVRAAGGIYLRATQPNRGAQMNLAAESARGDVLIFHHADSILTAAHVAAIRLALRDPAVIGGAFYRQFDARHPRLLWLETVGAFFHPAWGKFFWRPIGFRPARNLSRPRRVRSHPA